MYLIFNVLIYKVIDNNPLCCVPRGICLYKEVNTLGQIFTTEETARDIAYLYLNVCGRNATRTMKHYQSEHPEWSNTNFNGNGNPSRYIKSNALIQKYLREFEEENARNLANLRQMNIDTLSELAYSGDTNKRDRIAAIKELNSMCGYNSSNVNLNGGLDIEVVIE